MNDRSEITVLFDEPFWVALFERSENGMLTFAREIIGSSEPTGAELYAFFNRLDYDRLRYTKPVREEKVSKVIGNYKAQMRKAAQVQSDTRQRHVYTKAQALLKQQRQEIKQERKKHSREETDEEMRLRYELRQLKRKEKHRGH